MKYGKWCYIFVMAFVLLFVQDAYAAAKPIKVAFIRNHDLWIKIDKKEQQLTHGEKVIGPKWSYDGNWLAYQKEKQLWAYNVSQKKHYRLYQGEAYNYQWSPNQNILAFQLMGDINTINIEQKGKKFINVAEGISNYSWTPDGKGFIASSNAHLLPTGWSSVELFKIPKDANLDTKKVKHFYTLPKMSNDFFAIGTSIFKWSPDGKWIAFLGEPTASWSMDSNTLCVIRSDGKNFMQLDKMLINDEWFKWAPSKNILAYIEGEGRMAIENKHLKVKELPAITTQSLTPKGYVDRNITWHNNQLITTSRVKETEWSNDPKKRPLPFLYQVDIKTKQQKKITAPPKGYGDYSPEYLQNVDKLLWIRTNRTQANVWLANADGIKASPFIKNIEIEVPYYEKWEWDDVIDIY